MNPEIDIRNKTVTNELIHIGHPKSKAAPAITNSTIKDCEVIIQGASKSLISKTVFENCTINCKKATSHNFKLVQFINCKFTGSIEGSVLGSPDIENEGFEAKISGCDFSEVKMNLVDFRHGLEISTCKMPPWPHVTFERTNDSRSELKALDLPIRVTRMLGAKVLGEKNYYVYDLSKYDCDLEHAKEVVSKSSYAKSN